MRKTLLIPTLLLLVAPGLMAQAYEDLYIVPVAAHIVGNNNTTFVSDVALHNFQSSPLTVSFLFIESGLGDDENIDPLVSDALPSGSVTVPAGGSVIVSDVLNGFEGRRTGLIGSLIVSADRPFAMISRAYGTNATGTFGQSVVPVRGFIENTLGNTDNDSASAYIPGLTNNLTFRSNLGFVAAAGATDMTIEVTLRGANGTAIGKRSFTVPANQFVHLQFSTNDVIMATFDAGSAEFRITAGDGAVAPYGSVVDNRNADAIFIAGTFPNNAPFTLRSPIMDRFRRMADSFR